MAQWTPSSRLAQDLRFGPDDSSTMPKLIYGTAWKKEKTEALVHTAMSAGFRGIDTAGRSHHYREDLVRSGFSKACSEGTVADPKNIFIQSKMAVREGESDVSDTVGDSLTIRGGYLDAFLMHVPMDTVEETLRVWEMLSRWVPDKIGQLGISNVSLDELRELHDRAAVKPAVVQNRFYRETGYDVDLRRFCREKGIVFQSFWTLTANRHLVNSAPVEEVAKGVGVSKVVACYALVLGLEGIAILDGTTSERHMREDLEGVDKVGLWAEGDGALAWAAALDGFKKMIGEV